MRKYDNFCKALANLEEGAALEEPYSVVELTGIVGLFSICFEQSWKLMKELMERDGLFPTRTGSPRAVIKAAYQCGLLSDAEGWLDLLETRNLLAHTYSDEQAVGAVREVKFRCLPLFRDLKREIDRTWPDLAGEP